MKFKPVYADISSSDAITNAMSIDVEDYFQVSAFENSIARENWDQFECRVERNVNTLLDLLDESNSKATFFTLGWIAERYPDLVRSMVSRGHELASHGYQHMRVFNQTPDQFLADIKKTKAILEDLGGQAVRGYRAASFPIDGRNLWAYDCLVEAGYKYSSSIYPLQHDHYGMPDAPRFSFRFESNSLLEIPITTVDMMGRTMPAGGGGYFRFFPYAFSRSLIKKVNAHDRRSTIFYLHPWEIDPQQPKQNGMPFKSRVRHYLNLSQTKNRLRKLLSDFNWDRMDTVFSVD